MSGTNDNNLRPVVSDAPDVHHGMRPEFLARMNGVWQSGVLADATPVAVSMVGAPLPATLTLKSSDAGRKIEVKTSAGDYYTPVPDQTDPSSTHQMIVFVSAGIAAVRFTGAGAGGDTWSID